MENRSIGYTYVCASVEKSVKFINSLRLTSLFSKVLRAMISKKLCEVRQHVVANFLGLNFVGKLYILVPAIAHMSKLYDACTF